MKFLFETGGRLRYFTEADLDEDQEADDYDDGEEAIWERFDSEVLPMVQEQYEADGVFDLPARREAFNDWTDSLCKGGEMSDSFYSNIEHPASCD